jgi:hypothetical protein
MTVDTDVNRPPSRRGQRSRSTRGRAARGRRGRARRSTAVWQGEGRTLTDSATETSNAYEASDPSLNVIEQGMMVGQFQQVLKIRYNFIFSRYREHRNERTAY